MKAVAPQARRAVAMRVGAAGLGDAAMIGATFERAFHPGVERMVARLESQHHDRDGAVAGAGVVGLPRVEDPAVRGIETGLRDRADGLRRREEACEFDAAARAKTRLRLQPHPGLRDDPENAFGADEHPVRARPRARSGQASRLDHAVRRHDAQAFDEIVDMGIEAREMAAGPRRDPAAERRIFEALRKVAQRQAVRLQLGFERRPERAALDPGRARDRVDLQHLAEMAQIDGDGRLVAPVPAMLDAAADARSAAERRD